MTSKELNRNCIVKKKFEFAIGLNQHTISQKIHSILSNTNLSPVEYNGLNIIAWIGVKGPIDIKSGVVIELHKFKQKFNAEVGHQFDHQFFSDQTEFDILDHLVSKTSECCKRHNLELDYISITTPESITISYYAEKKVKEIKIPISKKQSIILQVEPENKDDNRLVSIIKTIKDKIQSNKLFSMNDLLNTNKGYVCTRSSSSSEVIVSTDKTQYLTTSVLFAGAHQLTSKEFTESELIQLFGDKCTRLHGHNFKLNITMMITLKQAKDLVEENEVTMGSLESELEKIKCKFNGKFYNELDVVTPNVSTCENIIQGIWTFIHQNTTLTPPKIELEETFNNKFELRTDYL